MTVVVDGGTSLSVADSTSPAKKSGLCVVATRGHFPVRNNTVVNGTRVESEINMQSGVAACSNLRLLYSNITTSTGEELIELVNATPFTLESAIRLLNIYTPFSYAGERQPLISTAASLVMSDECGAFLPPNTTFSIKTGALSAVSGNQVAACRSTVAVTKVTSTAVTSQIFSNAAVTTPSGGATVTYAVTPLAVLGIPETPIVSAAFFGTSIEIGQGDTGEAVTGHLGWLERGASNVNGFPMPFTNLSRDGGQSTSYVRSNSRFSTMRYVSHAVLGMHTNDIAAGTTLATLQTNALRGISRAKLNGCKVFYTTVLPRTTSTDNWATVENQTVVAGFGVDQIADQFNDWLLTLVANGTLGGIVDGRAAVSTSGNRWLPNLTGDGVHPNVAGHTALAVVSKATFETFKP